MTADPSGLAMTPRVPILAYHSISEGPPPLCLSPVRFREHLASLDGAGWRTMTLDDLLAGHARGGWPARTVMLTFDDGLASFATGALPILSQFGFSGILFAVAGRIGGVADWPSWPRDTPAEPLLDAGALREAAACGVEIGSHSCSHANLARLSPEMAAREILDSRAILEEVVGRPVRSFAYPFGDAPGGAALLVREHFAAGFGIELAYVSKESRVEQFERIDAHYFRHRSSLSGLTTAATRAYVSLRAVLRDARRAARS